MNDDIIKQLVQSTAYIRYAEPLIKDLIRRCYTIWSFPDSLDEALRVELNEHIESIEIITCRMTESVSSSFDFIRGKLEEIENKFMKGVE